MDEKKGEGQAPLPEEKPPHTPMLARSLHATKQFIETCGRHPFATGLFALLGIFGLVFSFVTFAIDQTDSKQDSKKVDHIQQAVERVASDVQSIKTESGEPSDFDPITVAYEPNDPDNITFAAQHIGKDVTWLQANDVSAFSNMPYFQYSLSSSAQKDFVQVAPYLLIEVIEVKAQPNDLATIYAGERGSGAELRSFAGSLFPVKGIQVAALVDDMTGKLRRDIDFFSLMPGEVEEFFLSLNYAPGWIYKFKVGFQYRYKGQNGVHWLDTITTTGIPDNDIPVKRHDEPYTVEKHPDYPPPESVAEWLTDAKAAQSIVTHERVFAPDMANISVVNLDN